MKLINRVVIQLDECDLCDTFNYSNRFEYRQSDNWVKQRYSEKHGQKILSIGHLI